MQLSQDGPRVLAGRHGFNRKIMANWKKRTAVKGLLIGPIARHSTVLAIEEETVIASPSSDTLLPLDDCLYARQGTIPRPMRSSLHRCLQLHGIGRLPETTGDRIFEAQGQGMLNRLLPHRHRRGANRRGQAAPVRRRHGQK